MESLPVFAAIISNNYVRLISLDNIDLITPFENLYPLSFAISLNKQSLITPLIQKLKNQNLLSDAMKTQAIESILDFIQRNPNDASLYSNFLNILDSLELSSLDQLQKNNNIQRIIEMSTLNNEDLESFLNKFENIYSLQTFKSLIINGRKEIFLKNLNILNLNQSEDLNSSESSTKASYESSPESSILHLLVERGMSDCLPQLYPLINVLSNEDQIKLFNHQNAEKRTFLHTFILQNNINQEPYKSIFKEFIDLYKDKLSLNIQDMFGNTLAHYVLEVGNFDGTNGSCTCVLKKLKEAGASFYIKNIHDKMVINMNKTNICLLNDLV